MSGSRWRLVIKALGLSLVALVLPWRAALADAPSALGLGAFAPWDDGAAIQAGYDTIVPMDDHESPSLLPETSSVAHDLSAPATRRFYATGIVGGSFLVASADNTPASSLTGGLALGMAMERPNGRIRLEAEGRYRGLIEQTYLGFNENFSPRHPNPVGVVQGKNLGGWSVLANAWRDFHWTDHV
ncbi:MAG: hypothetical protein ACR2IT_04720, partial [Pirellulales bacterium]